MNDSNKQESLNQIIELSKQGIEKIDQNELLNYFGAKKVEPIDEKLKKQMDNQKGWLIELLVQHGIALLEIGCENKEDVVSIYQSIQKWIDINDDKSIKFLLKFNLANNYYSKALKILFKQQDEKPTISNDTQIIEFLKKLNLEYAIYFYSNDVIMKYPKSFAKF